MAHYILYINRKKRHEETLTQFYASATLGTIEATSNIAALKTGRSQFENHPHIHLIDVVSFKRAPIFQQQFIQKKGHGNGK